MKIYEVTYSLNGSQHYHSIILAENTRQIPELLVGWHGGGTISFVVIKVQETHRATILMSTPIEKDLHNQLKECAR